METKAILRAFHNAFANASVWAGPDQEWIMMGINGPGAKRTEEEIEAIRNVFGTDTKISGFYSYGELSPFRHGGECRLHNQTMTITTFAED